MAGLSLGELIQDFINEIGEVIPFEERVSSLGDISQAITKSKPSKIGKGDIENLIEVLFQIRLALIEKKVKQERMDTLDDFIAELTTLSYKEPKQRTKKHNLYLLSLGKKLTEFTILLKRSSVVVPVMIFIEKIADYITTN